MLFKTHFSNNSLSILLFGLLLIIVSFYFFRKNKHTLSIIALTLGAFLLRFFVAGLDPFLQEWDEQFHAMVAKNMIQHPFTPMLYANPALPYNDSSWGNAHIWLHKQPFFLWLIAISIKIFGINELAVRLPSVILSALITPMIYRIGKLTVNEKMGYYSAFLFVSASYMLEVASGYIMSDHNDVAFMFFVTASFWAWFEYNHSKNKKWIYIIGLFSGIAVLVKWLMGLIIYFAWTLSILFVKEKRKSIQSYKAIFTSAITAAIVFVPWQVSILIRFPEQAHAAYASFSQHMTTVVENHGGDAFYHLNLIGEQFGMLVPYFLGLAFFLFYINLTGANGAKIVLTSWILTTYLLCAIAKTKMPLFVLISFPVIFLSLGNLLNDFSNYIEVKLKLFAVPLVWALFLVIGLLNLNLQKIENEHTDAAWDKRNNFLWRGYQAKGFKNIGKQLEGKDYVIYNCRPFWMPSLMFYSGKTAYCGIPDEDLILKLKSEGVKIAVLDISVLPDYICDDPDILILNLGPGEPKMN